MAAADSFYRYNSGRFDTIILDANEGQAFNKMDEVDIVIWFARVLVVY